MATAALGVHSTARALPWAWLVVPVGALTVMLLKAAVTSTVPGASP